MNNCYIMYNGFLHKVKMQFVICVATLF